MDKRWNYKNFNMVIELNIAGEFIYNGIQEINRLHLISNDAPTFIALCNLSVGIERLQKIVYVLWCMDRIESDEEFEKKLITHSHTGLRDEIKEGLKAFGHENEVLFTNRENDFFAVLQRFYNSARYMRFNIGEENDTELILLEEFLGKYVDIKSKCFVGKGIVATDEIKEFLGRIVGRISKKYYKLVRIGSERNSSFTYELRCGSKAEKIFRGRYRKDSLLEEQLNERIAFKELMIYLRRTRDKHAFFKYIDTIEPLEFEPTMIVEYLQEIAKGIVPQMLLDEVENLYEEKKYSFDRAREVDLFADTSVLYEYPEIEECGKIIKEIVDLNSVTSAQMELLRSHKEYIDNEDVIELLERIEDTYNVFVSQKCIWQEFYDEIKSCYEEYKTYLVLEKNL